MATKKQIKIRKMTNEVIDYACKLMKKKLNERVMTCNAIDWENVEENYLVPKLILCALLKECERQYRPLSDNRKWNKMIENIYKQI